MRGELRFSSPLWLRLGHDTKEYRFNDRHVHASFSGAHALCLTRNNTPIFWKEKYNWKEAYGVKINTEKFFYSIKTSLLAFNNSIKIWNKAYVELLRQKDLIDVLDLPSDFTMSHIRSKLASKELMLERKDLLDIALNDFHPLYEADQFNSTFVGLAGYSMDYYDSLNTDSLSLHEKEALCLKKTNKFTNENEYRIGLSLASGNKGFNKVIKFIVINCDLDSGAIEEVYDDVR